MLVAVTINLLLVLVLGVAVVALRQASRRQKLEEEYEAVKLKKGVEAEKGRIRAEEILEGAREESEHIIAESHHKAEEILRQFELLSQEEKEKVLEGVRRGMKEHVEKFGEEIGETLRQQAVEVAEETRKKAAEAYEKVEGEIEAYKAEKLRQVDKAIYDLVETVVKKVVGEGLTGRKQEELVMRALEAAKKEQVFSPPTRTPTESDSGDESTFKGN